MQPRWRSSIQSAKRRLGADYGSDQEFLTVKLRLKLKKVGKTTRSFRYDLNQIPYEYTVKVTNSFKGLDLIDIMLEELWTEVCNIVQEAVIKTIQRKINAKKQNRYLRSLTNSCENKRSVKQRRKRETYPLNAEFQRIARRDNKAFLNDQCQEIEKSNIMGKTRDLF